MSRKKTLLTAAAVFLHLASLWQLEICIIWVALDKQSFEFPFFLWTTTVWWARDFWYAVNTIAFSTVVLALVFPWIQKKRRRRIKPRHPSPSQSSFS